MQRDDLLVLMRDDYPNTRPVTDAELAEMGYVKRPVCGECEGSGCAMFPTGFVHSHSGADRHRPCPSCGGSGFGRLVALDGIDVEALRSAHFMVKKQVDPAIPNRPSVLVGWDAETVQTLIEQVLAAIDGEDTPRD